MAQRSSMFMVAVGAGVGFLACQQAQTFGPAGDESRFTVVSSEPEAPLAERPYTLAVPIPPTVERVPTPPRDVNVCPAPIILYLNFNGGPLVGNGNCNDGTLATPCSFIVSNGSTSFPAYTGSATQKSQTISLVQQYFAPFNVQVVTTRPSSGRYETSFIGGSPQNIGVSQGAAGVAPLDCGNATATDVSFAFSVVTQNNPHDVAVTIAQEAAHGFGLGHVNSQADIMYPALSSSANSFQNMSMPIYDLGGGSSDCTGTGMQNDVTLLNQNVGPACSGGTGGTGGSGGTGGTGGTGGSGGGGDMVPPTVSITSPANGATVPSSFQVAVTALDNSGTVAKVDLLVDGSQVQELTAPPWNFTVPAGLLAAGQHALSARAGDPSGNSQTSTVVNVTVQAGGGTGGAGGGAGGSGGGNPGGLGGSCMTGNQCNSGLCATDNSTGNSFCTQPCTGSCPSGFQCTSGYCVPGAGAGNQVTGDCSAAPMGARGIGASGLAALALVALVVARRRRK
jgi:Big-like domain-containing protein